MSPWQIAKLWVTRGMHLRILLEIYELRWGDEGRQKFDNILKIVKGLPETAVAQRLKLVRNALRRRKAGHVELARQVFVDTLVEYANAVMYTLPWFDQAGPLSSDVNVLIMLRGHCYAMIAGAIGVHGMQLRADEHITNIGWAAAKAVLWNAQRLEFASVKATCRAAHLLSASFPPDPKYERRKLHTKYFYEQAELLDQVAFVIFADVPGHLRSAFFGMNLLNEHCEDC